MAAASYLPPLGRQLRALLEIPDRLLRETAALTVDQLVGRYPLALVDACLLRGLFRPLLRYEATNGDAQTSDPDEETTLLDEPAVAHLG